MDKQKQIAFVAETEDDRYLFSKIYDKLTTAEQRNIPGSTFFLSPREQVLTARMLPGMDLHFWGGHANAERAVCCWLPDYLDDTWLSGDESPIAALRATYYEKDRLTHRDFLGSLMGCGIRRETVGDIYVGTGSCDFLVTAEILPYVLDNLVSAGRTKLHVEPISLDALDIPQQTVRQIRDTVSSLRLDSIVGSGFGMARGKASELISGGKVSLNDLPCIKSDKLLSEGDKVSARGFGKLILRQVGGRTKKDRISILLERYV
jgi:RNA-binding protein YlmH